MNGDYETLFPRPGKTIRHCWAMRFHKSNATQLIELALVLSFKSTPAVFYVPLKAPLINNGWVLKLVRVIFLIRQWENACSVSFVDICRDNWLSLLRRSFDSADSSRCPRFLVEQKEQKNYFSLSFNMMIKAKWIEM